MDEIVKTYNPPYSTSTNVYSHIKENLGMVFKTLPLALSEVRRRA